MQKHDDSLQINTDNEFVFDLTKEKINQQSLIRGNQTYDDLEYSMDQPSYQCILADLGKEEPRPIPNISAPVTVNREEDKKKQRKAIFEKYKQKTDNKVDVMGLFDDVLRGKGQKVVPVTLATNEDQNRQIANSNQYQEVQTVPSNGSQGNKMNPPPNLLKKNSLQSSKGLDGNPISNIQIKNSNISMGNSFSLYDGFSAIMGNNNNPFANSRQSQQIAELLDAQIFGSMRIDEKSMIQVEVNDNQNMNILDDIRISAIGIGSPKMEDEVFFNANNLADSGEIVVPKAKEINIQQVNKPPNIKFDPVQNSPTQQVPPTSEPNIRVIPEIPQSNHQHQNIIPFPDTYKPPQNPNSLVPQHPNNPNSQNSNSKLSLNSNFVKGTNNSSYLLDSNSLSKALGNLSQHIFLQALPQTRMPQLLRQSWRLNSISINIHSLTLSLDALRHKQIIRSLIFQLLMASQTLQKFRDELETRELKQKRLYTSFTLAAYLESDWYQSSRVRNNEVIKPNEPHPKRPTDFNNIKETLKNSVEVLRYFQNFIDRFKIQPTDEFKKKYIELRTSLFEIFSNLKKISEDLYMKSINLSLPLHYYSFYEYMKNPEYISTDKVSPSDLSKKIKQKEKILLQIEYFKNQHDPLASSALSKDIQVKAKNEISILKAAFYNSRRASLKT